MNAPRFNQIRCSQCGCAFGPGDAGYSSCSEHRPKEQEVHFDCKYLSLPGDGMVQVKALFVAQGEGIFDCTGLYAGPLHLGSWLDNEALQGVEMEARDALFAELTADAAADVETRAECRRDDARADYPVPLPRMAPTYTPVPTPAQMADADELFGLTT